MRRVKRWGFIALFIFLGIEILIIAPKKLNTFQDIKPKVGMEIPELQKGAGGSQVTTTAQDMLGVRLFGTADGHKEWELNSDSAYGFKDKGAWKLKGVHVKFFGKTGTEYTVEGETGSIQLETKDMEIKGNVVTTTSDGYVVKSPHLKYLAKEKLLETSEEVEMTGPKSQGKFEVSGRGLKADLNTNIINLKENVKAVKVVSNEKPMTIHSVWMRVFGKTNQAHFEEQVQVDLDQVRMTGHEADFVYDNKDKILKSLLLQGNVRVTDRQRWASSKKAQVMFAENQFILSGDPQVVQDDNELRGEEIRFLNGGKEVQVIKAKARVDQDKYNSRAQ